MAATGAARSKRHARTPNFIRTDDIVDPAPAPAGPAAHAAASSSRSLPAGAASAVSTETIDGHVVDSSSKPWPGNIEEITLVNIMCHDRLHLTLNPRVNFITGKNGSGKSAIAAALSLVFGGSLDLVGRGRGASAAIKNGRNQATISVKIWNEGAQGAPSYMPDRFGNRIIVVRTLKRQGKSASSDYALKNPDGSVVLTGLDAVKAMCKHFKIQPENPLTNMGQEKMKHFAASSPADLHAFLMKGTSMDEYADNIMRSQTDLEDIRRALKLQQDSVDKLREVHEEAVRELESVRALADAEGRIRDAEADLAWSEVAQLQARLEDYEAEAESFIKSRDTILERIGEIERGTASLEAKKEERLKELDGMKDAARTLNNRLDDLTSRISRDIKPRRSALEEKVSALKKELRTKNREMTEAAANLKRLREQRGNVSELQSALEAAEADLDSAREADRAATADLRAADERLEAINDEVSLATKSSKAARASRASAHDELEAARSELAAFSREHLDEVIVLPGGTRVSPSRVRNMLSTGGSTVVALLGKIAQLHARTPFRGHVAGPLGALVEVLPSSASDAPGSPLPAVERVLYRQRHTLFFSDSSDMQRVREVMTEEARRTCGLTLVSAPSADDTLERLHAHGAPPDSGLRHVFDIVRITSPFAAAALLDVEDLNTHWISTSQTLAREIASRHRRLSIYSADGDRYMATGASISFSPAISNNNSSFIHQNPRIMEATLRTAVTTAEAAFAEADAAANEADVAARRVSEAIIKAKAAREAAASRQSKTSMDKSAAAKKVEQLRKTLTDRGDDSMDVDAELSSRVERLRGMCDAIESDISMEQQNLDELEQEAKPYRDEMAALEEEIRTKADESRFHDEISKLEGRIDKAKRAVAEVRKTKLAEAERSLAVKKDDILKTREGCTLLIERVKALTQWSGPREGAPKTTAAAESALVRLKAVQERTAKELLRDGRTLESIEAAERQARRSLDQAEDKLAHLNKLYPTLADHADRLLLQHKRLVDEIESKARAEFKTVMNLRGHEGVLSFGDAPVAAGTDPSASSRSRVCNVRVTTRAIESSAVTGTSAAGRAAKGRDAAPSDIGMLSGGEKGLTSVGLLMAFGASMGSPWRLFDEFDVFMDEEARRMVMELMMNRTLLGASSGRYSASQLICITPHDVSSAVKPSADVRVLVLRPPDRGHLSASADSGGGGVEDEEDHGDDDGDA